MLVHDDVIYQILLWLPVISLLRFKSVCRSWCALIESSDFIKQHLHHHHYNPSLKDKSHNLVHLLPGKDSIFTFALTSIEGFEEPNAYEHPDCSELHAYSPEEVVDMVSYNGIVCLNLLNRKFEESICLWNPATKQSRVLPQSPSLNRLPAFDKVLTTVGPSLNRLPAFDKVLTTVGFGFDVKSNGYKVVNLIRNVCNDEKRVEVYSLNTGSWRSVTTVLPFRRFLENSKMPFNNGTCFFWLGYNSCDNVGIICFDFCSEMFRSISLPCTDYSPSFLQINLVSVVRDKIARVLSTKDRLLEMWVFNEYGTVNESWTKLYTIDTCSVMDRYKRIKGVSMNGYYIFYKSKEQICRLNVVTKETKCFTFEIENIPWWLDKTMVEFKESLVSVLDA